MACLLFALGSRPDTTSTAIGARSVSAVTLRESECNETETLQSPACSCGGVAAITLHHRFWFNDQLCRLRNGGADSRPLRRTVAPISPYPKNILLSLGIILPPGEVKGRLRARS